MIILAVAGLLWYAQQSGWSPVNGLGSSILSGTRDDRLFVPPQQQGGLADEKLTQAEARALYRRSRQALSDEDYATALAGFQRLEPIYPGLAELILIHQGAAYAGLNQEAAAQKQLGSVVKHHGDSPLAPRAAYMLAQSHYRARQPAQARHYFEWVRSRYADSKYAVASLYSKAPSVGSSTEGAFFCPPLSLGFQPAIFRGWTTRPARGR